MEERFIAPMAHWLDTDDAPRHAALLTAQVVGLSIAVNVLSLHPLTTPGRDELIDLIAPLIQSTIEEAGPPAATPLDTVGGLAQSVAGRTIKPLTGAPRLARS